MTPAADRTMLAGEFVRLRPLTVEDAPITFRWRQSARAVLLNKGADSVDQQTRWIAVRPADEYNFIVETNVGQPIGMLSLSAVDLVNSRAEPGRFLIGEEKAAQGVPAAAEAMLLLYQFAFEHLGLHRVHGTVVAANRRMIKWQLYMGMSQEGCLRDHYFIDGRFQDAICFGLLKGDYQRIARPKLQALVAAARLRPAKHSVQD